MIFCYLYLIISLKGISRKKSDPSPTGKIFYSHVEKERLLKFRELLIKQCVPESHMCRMIPRIQILSTCAFFWWLVAFTLKEQGPNAFLQQLVFDHFLGSHLGFLWGVMTGKFALQKVQNRVTVNGRVGGGRDGRAACWEMDGAQSRGDILSYSLGRNQSRGHWISFWNM